MSDFGWGTAPSHQKTAAPALSEVAAMIRAGESLEVIARQSDRAPRTLRDALRRSGWDPDTGMELTPVPLLSAESPHEARVGDTTWMRHGECVGSADPAIFFPVTERETRAAKKVCRGCPVREECLTWALTNDEQYGVWGGLSETERANRQSPMGPGRAIAHAAA